MRYLMRILYRKEKPKTTSKIGKLGKRSENFYLRRIIYSFFDKGAFRSHCKSDITYME